MAWSGHRFGPGRSGSPFNHSLSTDLKQKLGQHSWIFSSVRKLVSCSECGISHRPCSPCKYLAAAQSKCLRLGINTSDFKLHLDLDLIESDNLVYLSEPEEPSKPSTLAQQPSSYPVASTSHPATSTAHPATSTAHPATSTTHPATSTSHPATTTSHPATSTSHLATSTAHPATSTSHLATSTSHPATSTSRPATSTSHPATSTSHPATSTSHLATSTAHPATSTSHLATSTSHPATSTSRPATSTSHLATPTSHLATSTSHPATSTSHLATPTSHLATSTSHPATSTSHPATSTSHPATSTSHPATSTSHPATSTSHLATPTSHLATSTSHLATSTAHPATSTSHLATSTSHPATSTSHPATPEPSTQPPLLGTQPAPAGDRLPPWDRGNVHSEELFLFSEYKEVLNKSRIVLRNNLRLHDVWPHLQQMTVITQNDEERMRLNAINCDSVDRLITFINSCETWCYHALLRAMALTQQGHLIPQEGLPPEVYMQDIQPPVSTPTASRILTESPAPKQHFYRKVDSEVNIPISTDLLPGLLRHCEVSERLLMKAGLFGFHDDITIDLTQFQICIDVKCTHNREQKAVKSKELFNQLFQRHAPNTVLIEGEAGSGKSTYTQDYAHRHCEEFIECEGKGAQSPCLGHSWKLILYIPAGSVIGSQEAAILDNLHCDDKHKDQIMEMIKDDGEGVLLINDGLDELRKQIERDSIRQYTITHQKSGRPKILNSSRNGLCHIEGKFFDRIVTLDGFSLIQGLDYVEQYFKESSNADHSALLEYIKQQKTKLEWVLTNPLRVHIFCELTIIGQLTQEDIRTLTSAKLLKKLEAYVVRRDEKCRESDTADTHSAEFYMLCLESFLGDERNFTEQSIADMSPYKAFLKKDNTLSVYAREKRYYKFGHQVFLEYFSIQGLVHLMKSNPPNKKALLLCLCAELNMRNPLQLLCGYVSEYEPELHDDLVLIIQACIMLQIGELTCEKTKTTERLQQLPDIIKENFMASAVYKGVGEEQEKVAMDICEEIQAAFNKNAECLRTAGFFFNLYKTDLPGNMLRVPTQHLQFIIQCLRQCAPSLHEKVCSQSIHQLLPCVRYNMMDGHMNGDSYVVPVSGLRWGSVRDQGIEGGFLRYMSIIVWCPSDIAPTLRQAYTHRNPAQPTDGTPFLSNTFYINIDDSRLWGEPPDEAWACEEWVCALGEVLQHRPAGINVSASWSRRTIPLYGLFTALRQVITPAHSLRRGVGVTYGQVSEEVLEEFCEWMHSVNLRVKLGDTTVLLNADRDEDYVTHLHRRILAMIDSDSAPSYITPGGHTVEYSQHIEATAMKTDDSGFVSSLFQSAELTYNPSSETSVGLAELDLD